MDYYQIAKRAYCTEGDQFDCRDCEMVNYFIQHGFDAATCREKIIIELVKIIEELKETKC